MKITRTLLAPLTSALVLQLHLLQLVLLIVSTLAAAPCLCPLQQLLPDCIQFSCCSPIMSASAATPWLPLFVIIHMCSIKYRKLWLFNACAYKQETMRLTDNVRLTSGITVATPSKGKHMIAKRLIDRERWTNYKNGEDDKRPSVRRLYFSSPYFQRDKDSKNRGDCTSSTRSRKPSWSKCCGFAQSRWNGDWTCD